MSEPMLVVRRLVKEYRRSRFGPPTFRLEADFSVEEPTVVGVMGPNRSGNTTLFELIKGSNRQTACQVLCAGLDIHVVRPNESFRVAMH
jgi:ABC-type branched-subunit amino acid transport system ATPase component